MKTHLFVLLIVLAVLSRFLPHPPNFSPIGALALFAGAFVVERKWALVIPLVALLVSDIFLGLHEMMLFVYLSYALIAGLGIGLKNAGTFKLAGRAVFSSAIFFVVSNFGVWLMSGMYAKTWSGLVQCYVAAIPFIHYTLSANCY